MFIVDNPKLEQFKKFFHQVYATLLLSYIVYNEINASEALISGKIVSIK